jgi:hypothetical protein
MSVARALALALAACASLASSSSAMQSVNLRVAFRPDRPGAQTTIEFTFRISGPRNTAPSPVTSLDLRLPAHMGIDTTTLGQNNCYAANLIDRGLEGCSANARIGFGDATVIVPFGTEAIQEKASLNTLMGPPAENHLEVLFYAEALFPVFAQLVFPGVVLADTKPFGEQIATSIPLGPGLAGRP